MLQAVVNKTGTRVVSIPGNRRHLRVRCFQSSINGFGLAVNGESGGSEDKIQNSYDANITDGRHTYREGIIKLRDGTILFCIAD